MNGDLSDFTRGAQLLRHLCTIPPGKAMDVTVHMLSDIIVPANPLDRQTPEYLVNWFHARMPFYCTVTPDLPGFPSKWTFYRPIDAGQGERE